MKRIATIIIGLALLLPTSALASSSTCLSYNPQLCSVVSNEGTRTPGATPPATVNGTLPFTGLDVVLLAAGGGMLLGAGLVVRRLSRHAAGE